MVFMDVSKPIPYKITKKYNLDDVIKHKTFGIGIVPCEGVRPSSPHGKERRTAASIRRSA